MGLGFAGGAMVWMVFSDLVAVVVTLSVAATVAFQFLIR